MNNIDSDVMLKRQPKKFYSRVSFSKNENQRLISLVHGYPCLWQKAHKDYTNRVIRKAAWKRITNIFGDQHDEDEVFSKWTNLRKQYRKAVAKKKANPKVKAVWKFYEDMNFLSCEQNEDAQRTGSNNNIDHECEEAFDEKFLETRPESICNSYSINEDSNHVEMKDENSSVFEYEDLNTSASPEATKIEDSCQRNVVTESVVAVSSPEHAGVPVDDVRNSAFVNFLLSELRSLNQQDANMLRFRLQRTLLEFTEERHTQIDIRHEI